MNLPDAVEAEATGQRHVVAHFRGCEYKLVLDVDDWPLDLVYGSVGVRAGKLVAAHTVVAQVLERLLGDQWPGFLRAHPRRRDLVPASQAFAAAVGFPAEPYDLSFGAIPRLLVTLEQHTAAVEATLHNTGLDYRDRWRYVDGFRKLTLRRIYVALHHMPPTSPLAVAQNGGKMPLTGAEILLMDLFEAVARTPHPSRPMTPAQKAERSPDDKVTQAVADYRKRHPKTPREAQRNVAVATAIANAQIIRNAADARS